MTSQELTEARRIIGNTRALFAEWREGLNDWSEMPQPIVDRLFLMTLRVRMLLRDAEDGGPS